MTIGETIKKNQPKEYQRLKKKKRKRKRKKRNEKLSEKDIKELMGHSSYRRGTGGAIRQVR